MALRHVILFDGDDTLWKTQELYDEAKRAFALLMESINIHEEDVIAQLDKLDAQRVAIRGFTIERFVESMLILYARLSLKHGLDWNVEVEEKIHGLATFITRPPQLYEDALPALEKLKSYARLVLVSVGDPALQELKLNSLNIRHHFERVHIVSSKNEELLRQILQQMGLSLSDTWFVGNSPRSDIHPALKVGMSAVLVARRTWCYDELPHINLSGQNSKRFHVVSSLSEAAGIILKELGERQ